MAPHPSTNRATKGCQLFGSIPIRSFTADRMRCLQPRYFAVFPLPETTAEDKGAAHVTFLLNFNDALRRKLPVGK
jgi:hypothetical protein